MCSIKEIYIVLSVSRACVNGAGAVCGHESVLRRHSATQARRCRLVQADDWPLHRARATVDRMTTLPAVRPSSTRDANVSQ